MVKSLPAEWETQVQALCQKDPLEKEIAIHFSILVLNWWLRLKESAYNVGNLDSIPGSERSPGEGNSNPLQYSCLENPMDGGA